MQIQLTNSTAAFDKAAATCVLESLKTKPDSVIALPTGRTPLGLYKYLVESPRIKAITREAFFFNLDDYVGVSENNPQSFAAFVKRHFLNPACVQPAKMRLLRADAPDLAAEAIAYDEAIADHHGIDLAILGLGANGHIAFNEPGAKWDKGTHITTLTSQTRQANAAYVLDGTAVPAHGITMGIKTIREARQVLLLVQGIAKRQALRVFLDGKPDPAWPVTSLCEHPNLTVVAEETLVA